MKKIKAWAITEDGNLFSYIFSYTGEKTLMVFPTQKDAKIFRGETKSWKIKKIEIKILTSKKNETK